MSAPPATITASAFTTSRGRRRPLSPSAAPRVAVAPRARPATNSTVSTCAAVMSCAPRFNASGT